MTLSTVSTRLCSLRILDVVCGWPETYGAELFISIVWQCTTRMLYPMVALNAAVGGDSMGYMDYTNGCKRKVWLGGIDSSLTQKNSSTSPDHSKPFILSYVDAVSFLVFPISDLGKNGLVAIKAQQKIQGTGRVTLAYKLWRVAIIFLVTSKFMIPLKPR